VSVVHVEHRAKALLAEAGIPVPEGRLATTPAAAAAAATELGGTVMLKAQVARSDRMRSGGIATAAGPVDAAALAREMLGGDVQGATVRTLLVERRVEADGELYVGAVYDPLLRSPVLVASRSGGTGVEAAQTVREPFSATTGCAAHVARRLGRRLELEGRVLLAFSDVARRLADLFLAADATLLEINPLLIVGDGVVAVDAHLAVDGEALARQPQPDAAASAGLGEDATELERAAAEIDASDHRGVAGRVVEFGGPVGLLIGGGGASLTVFDAVLRRGLEPFNYCEIGGNPTAEKIARLTALLLSHSRVEQLAVVMNVVNNTRADLIAEGVIAGTLEAGRNPATTIAAFRVPGHDETRCRDLLAAHGVEYLDQTVSLEGAIDRVADARQAVAS
jgi:succinyl-CoA synthetase beta subunit/citryl-CoA synthetase large subunit